MKIEIRYENNRLDIFDTNTFSKPEPFDGTNMLTNFEVRVDTLGSTGLWLVAHFYDTGEAYSKHAKEGETPVGHRKRGWRFLLAEAGELSCVESVSVDGQVTLMRIAGELADMVRFEQMCRLWLAGSGNQCIAQRAVSLADALCSAYPEHSADAEKIARMCGFSAPALDELRERTATQLDDEELDEEDEWISEFANDCDDGQFL